MSRRFSTAQVARVLGVRESWVRSMARQGLCRPSRERRGYAFSFQDLVVLRTARGLIDQRVPPARVARALATLVEALPEGRPLSGVRVFADGRSVAVRQGSATWNAETGQTLLSFEIDELAALIDAVHEREVIGSRPQDPADEARAAFEAALNLEDEDPVGACAAYRRTLDLDPDLVDAYINLGRLVHQAGDAREAVSLYHRALERAPDDPIIHFNLALALEDSKGVAPALAHYRRAVTLDPSFADAHFNLAGLCEQLGLESDALRHYAAYKKLTGR